LNGEVNKVVLLIVTSKPGENCLFPVKVFQWICTLDHVHYLNKKAQLTQREARDSLGI